MRLYDAFCGLLMGGRPTPGDEAQETLPELPVASWGPAQTSLLVIHKDPTSFYHSLTDEDFVGWLRGWGNTPQVLRPEDRDFLLDRARDDSLAF